MNPTRRCWRSGHLLGHWPTRRWIACAALTLLGATGAAAQTPGGNCAALRDLKIEDTNLLSSAVVPAKDDLPEYCRVLGYVRPAINFEIRLPTKAWNGKLYMAGCGAQCGQVGSDQPGFANAMNHGLRRNYAAVTMDGGHWGRHIFDRRWTEVPDPIARFDYEQRAVTATAKVTKEVIGAYYGRAPARSYFAGCSNGGRQANMEAWKYPEDFDGIISGCPNLNFAAFVAAGAWQVKADTGPDGKNVVAFAKVPMLAKAVYAACAGPDGLIEDPRQCRFEPKSLQCPGADGPDCLTAAEVRTLEAWYGGPRNGKGEQVYPGVPKGSEPYWSLWLTAENEADWQAGKRGIEHILRFYGLGEDPGAGYDARSFDLDRDVERLKRTYVNREAGGTDLSKFKARSGKLLIYQGLADANTSPEATRLWYEDLTKAMSGEAGTRDFARLFLVPGMDHCGVINGPGVHHSGFDPLPALERWVEEGVAPESIVMTKRDKEGKSEWARPVCVYPLVARFKGAGDRKDPSNWSCGAP
jgi:Tannase and feruloyl esterase